jgi:hypothetical protein
VASSGCVKKFDAFLYRNQWKHPKGNVNPEGEKRQRVDGKKGPGPSNEAFDKACKELLQAATVDSVNKQ